MPNNVISIVRNFRIIKRRLIFYSKTDENFWDLYFDHILYTAMTLKINKNLNPSVVGLEKYEALQQILEQEILETILKDTNKSEL